MSLTEESLTEDQTRYLMCTWSGGQIPRMEWLFLGGNVIIPLEHTDRRWDKAVLLCRSSGRLQRFEPFTVQGIHKHFCAVRVFEYQIISVMMRNNYVLVYCASALDGCISKEE